jgi:lipooligosaccharide transport system ATP-binding protein
MAIATSERLVSAVDATVPGPIIQAKAVGKRFGDVEALNALDLEVCRGECVGLLGPNGAGKSTFIGCLYGVVERSEGELSIFGLDPRRAARAIKKRIGVVPQENALDEELTVLENMRLYARFAGLVPRRALPRIQDLLAEMSLDHKADATIRELSGGMKRRLAFVRALLVDPELLILDEPTTGLDPAVRHVLWEKVLDYRHAGKTVLLTTHYMHEAELLCSRVVILNRGQVIASGPPQELIARHAPGYVGYFPAQQEAALRLHLKSDWPLFRQGHQTCVRVPRLEDLTVLQTSVGSAPLQLRPANLEDVYLKLTGHGLSDDE